MISFNIAGQSGGISAFSARTPGKLNINTSVFTAAASQAKSPLAIKSQAATATANSNSVDRKLDELFADNSLSNTALLKYMTTGQDPDAFSKFITAYTRDSSGYQAQLSDYDVEGIVNTIGAKFAALTHEIENGDFSDQDKQELLDSLQKQLEEGMDVLADSFGNAADSLFSNLGLKSHNKTAGQALADFVTEKKDYYLDFIKSSEGKQYIADAAKNNPDLQLATNDVDLTEVILRHEAEKQIAAEKAAADKDTKDIKDQNLSGLTKPADQEEEDNKVGSGKFTLEDLQMLSKLQSNFTSFWTDDANKTEEQFGYQMGLTYIKAQEIMKENGASNYLTSLFNNNFDNYIETKVDTLNSQLKDKQKTAEETTENVSNEAYKELDSSKIMQAFNMTKAAYNNSGSAADSIVDGFESVSILFNQSKNENPNTIRYSAGNNFFNNFYSSGKDDNGYNLGMSTFHRYNYIMNRMA